MTLLLKYNNIRSHHKYQKQQDIMIQAVNLVEDSSKEIYCIIDPLLCLQQAQEIPQSSLIQCRYCKSLHIPKIQSKQYQCPICKCFTDLPENYSSIVPIAISSIVLTNQLQVQPKNHPPVLHKNMTQMHKSKPQSTFNKAKLRILIVCQSQVGLEFYDGLQCLVEILPQYMQHRVEICLVMYDTRIKLIELEPDGRVIVVGAQSLELINDKYYPVCEDTLNQLFLVLSQKQPKTTLNSTKVITEVLKNVAHSHTLVLWLGDLNQSINFYSYPCYPNIDVCCLLKIANSLSTHSQMQALSQLNKNSSRVKYILQTDSKKTITEKVHYQLYDILWNCVVEAVKVQGSRERKYPPQILTNKERILGSLKNCVVVVLGKNSDEGEKIQIRIKYSELLQKQQKKPQKSQIPQALQNSLLSPHKILVINLRFHRSLICQQLNLSRYLQLYKWIKTNPTNLQLRSAELRNEIDIDICQFLRECTYTQRIELNSSIQNVNCIYSVWPWIGLQKSKADMRIQDSVKFMYYFTGYYISEQEIKSRQHKQESTECLPYAKQIEYLNELCQVLYSQYDKRVPLYYQHILEDIEVPSHLHDSDNEQDLQMQESQGENSRYYSYQIK